jgi:hypothetical protein
MEASPGREQLDLRQLLAAVEEAPPVVRSTCSVVSSPAWWGATRVALLIANFSGDAVVRMTTS